MLQFFFKVVYISWRLNEMKKYQKEITDNKLQETKLKSIETKNIIVKLCNFGDLKKFDLTLRLFNSSLEIVTLFKQF